MFSLGSALLLFGVALLMLVLLSVDIPFSRLPTNSILPSILTATSLFAVGLLLLPSAWLSLQRLRGRESQPFCLLPMRHSTWIAIPLLWVLILTLGSLFYNAPGANWYIPFLHFLAVGLPIYVLLRMTINRIPLGSSLRGWGMFNSGMTVSPLLALMMEMSVLAFFIMLVLIVSAGNPATLNELERIFNRIQNAATTETQLMVLGPLLNSPLTLVMALVFLSGFVPVIEELTKSIGVWLLSGRLSSPAQGFALGAISGAGFALVESLLDTLVPDSTWPFTLIMRALSGLMHMLASGLVGWGIAYVSLEKRTWRMLGMTTLAMLLHATWNAGAVMTVAGGVRMMLAQQGSDVLGILMSLFGAGLILLLVTGMFVTLILLNLRLR